jgi:hypothetical protein
MRWSARAHGLTMRIGSQPVSDILIALQTAHLRANATNKPMAVMDDLSVQEVTMYTETKAIEIIHPLRKDYVRCGDGQRENFAN